MCILWERKKSLKVMVEEKNKGKETEMKEKRKKAKLMK